MFEKYPDVVSVTELCKMLGGISKKLAYKMLANGVQFISFTHQINNAESQFVCPGFYRSTSNQLLPQIFQRRFLPPASSSAHTFLTLFMQSHGLLQKGVSFQDGH